MMEDFDENEEKLKGDKKLPFSVLVKRNMYYIKPELKGFIASLILMLINVGLDILVPYIQGKIIGFLGEDVPLLKIILYVLCFAVLGIGNQVLLYYSGVLLQKIGQRIVYNMRMDVFSHIENMSQNQFNEMPVGSLVTRVASYTASMCDLYTSVFVNILRNILTIFGVLVLMFFISPALTGIMLIFVVIVFIISIFFERSATKVLRNERKYISDLNTFLNENLSGMKITQIFNQEERKKAEFDEKNRALFKARFKIVLIFGIFRPVIFMLHMLAVATVFYFAPKMNFDSAMIVTFYISISKLFNPIENLADLLNNLQKAFTASERLINLMDVEPEVLDKEDAIEIDKFEGKIEFKNVWFAYKKDEWILKDVSFVIEPKQTVAFVGATGAGKTTILSLIVRNYEIQKGEILIDGININDIKIESLRRGIGQMLQDVFMFSGNIRNNITLHDDSYTEEEVMEVCKYVNADKVIEKNKAGLDTEVIERGENFSSGERQLLSFARTVLAKPQILILDEATANIDTETEVLIQESLEKMKNIGTMLVVAHRLSTIQHSDNIIVLQNGQIVEQGNHQELLSHKGYYHKLYQLQFESLTK